MTDQHRNELNWDEWTRRGRLPVFVARHGQTAWNLERRFLGKADIPLDDTGLQQARKLGHRLAQVPFSAAWSSNLQRASQTAQAIVDRQTGLSHHVDADLAELDQGVLESQPGHVLPTRYPEFFEAWVTDPADARVPGGETMRECQTRAVAALRRIADGAVAGAPIVVVTHQMVLSTFICSVLELPLKYYSLIKQGNTALNLLSWDGSAFAVHRLNDTAHIDEP